MDMNLGDTQIILKECKRYGCSRRQAAYILATARWETAHTMKPVKEAYWLTESWRERNLRYYPWYGRGYVQLTWERNYEYAGEKIGVDLIGDPDRAMVPENAAKILVAGSMEGWFTGKSLKDYINEGGHSYVAARRVINGTDKATDISNLADDYYEELGDYESISEESDLGGFLQALKNLLKAILK